MGSGRAAQTYLPGQIYAVEYPEGCYRVYPTLQGAKGVASTENNRRKRYSGSYGFEPRIWYVNIAVDFDGWKLYSEE